LGGLGELLLLLPDLAQHYGKIDLGRALYGNIEPDDLLGELPALFDFLSERYIIDIGTVGVMTGRPTPRTVCRLRGGEWRAHPAWSQSR
jgi:hypothetical protein